MYTQTPFVPTFDSRTVLAQFRRATQRLFHRRIEALPALGVESAMPGLEISDSTFAAWEAEVQRRLMRSKRLDERVQPPISAS